MLVNHVHYRGGYKGVSMVPTGPLAKTRVCVWPIFGLCWSVETMLKCSNNHFNVLESCIAVANIRGVHGPDGAPLETRVCVCG